MAGGTRKRRRVEREDENGSQDTADLAVVRGDLNRVFSFIVKSKICQEENGACGTPGAILRKFGVIVGVNAVTRTLQTGKARLLLVTSDANPRTLTDHLISVATKNSIPTLSFSGTTCEGCGSLELGAALGLRSALAICFTVVAKEDGVQHKGIQLIENLIERLSVSKFALKQ
ncbi:hypothetical protein CYMTET_10708 [Cymbomonas tetramitiformis]|uniref:Ribosomal protein eL8/eL30/eS12/Gadd45 domain-containing protein n=1 Tax=Cymbomonas tetramitiformis TaxID=36881 RepID=A0AAE0GNL8_9CHLO|nr:hypothetical protein CYMTET_10708 [Cymbomonas tetramitiformis]